MGTQLHCLCLLLDRYGLLNILEELTKWYKDLVSNFRRYDKLIVITYKDLRTDDLIKYVPNLKYLLNYFIKDESNVTYTSLSFSNDALMDLSSKLLSIISECSSTYLLVSVNESLVPVAITITLLLTSLVGIRLSTKFLGSEGSIELSSDELSKLLVGISRSKLSLLNVLSELKNVVDCVTYGSLSKRLGVNESTISRHVDSLVNLGLVSKVRRGRKYCLSTTKLGDLVRLLREVVR